MVVGAKVVSFISNQVKDIFSLPDQGPLYVFKVCELIAVYFHALVTTDKVNNVLLCLLSSPDIGVLNLLPEFCNRCGALHPV